MYRRRLSAGVVAPLKIASGCDRRCSFCAIPSFRGAFVSRRPPEILAEARWLASQGVRELFLVSENSTSYGKDLGNLRLLEEVLPDLAATEGIERVRISYLQPAELRPGLIEVIASTPGVADYFDLSFQHASGSVLRAMRRFGDRERFGDLLDQIRGSARGPASDPTSSSASPARPPPTWPNSSCSWAPRASTRSVSSVTPTRTAPRPRPDRASWTARRSPAGWRSSPP